MPRKKRWLLSISLIAVTNLFLFISATDAAPYKILVVMSYEKENPWCIQIKEGIDSVLADISDIEYFYMDTKKDYEGGVQKAKDAYELFVRYRPNGVIAADDNAQKMFVLPYLKNRVDVPVMFCAVNEAPEKYGYPASNVSGILERNFISESIAFAKQLVPSIQTIGFLVKDSPSGRAIQRKVQNESDIYLAHVTGFKLVKSVQEIQTVLAEYKKTTDALYITATSGILDEDGKSLDNEQVTRTVANIYQKPLIGANNFHVRYGVLCAVIKSGNTQGRISAEMLLKAIKGTSISQLPITNNKYGKRMLNVTVMKKLGIKPNRRVLVGTELVETSQMNK